MSPLIWIPIREMFIAINVNQITMRTWKRGKSCYRFIYEKVYWKYIYILRMEADMGTNFFT